MLRGLPGLQSQLESLSKLTDSEELTPQELELLEELNQSFQSVASQAQNVSMMVSDRTKFEPIRVDTRAKLKEIGLIEN